MLKKIVIMYWLKNNLVNKTMTLLAWLRHPWMETKVLNMFPKKFHEATRTSFLFCENVDLFYNILNN